MLARDLRPGHVFVGGVGWLSVRSPLSLVLSCRTFTHDGYDVVEVEVLFLDDLSQRHAWDFDADMELTVVNAC